MWNMNNASQLTTEIRKAEANGDAARVLFLRDVWCANEFCDFTDRDLFDATFYTDAKIIEHDSHCCCDEECIVSASRRYLAALTHEADRRARYRITVTDPNAPTLEEELRPFGLEWEREQRDRMAS